MHDGEIIDGETGGAFSLERAMSAVRRRLHIVALVGGLCTGVAIAIVMLLPNRYDASSVVQIDPRKKTISNMESVLADLQADSATVDSEVEIIKSRSVALKVIDILGLRQDAEFTSPTGLGQLLRLFGLKDDNAAQPEQPHPNKAGTDPIANLLGSSKPGATQPERDEVAATFYDRLKVARVRSTLLIDIRFSSADPVKAARIANTIAEVYLADQLAEKKHAAGFASGALDTKLTELRTQVSDAERKVAQFKADNNIFDSEGTILSEKQLARHMEQAVMARNATAEARAKYEQVLRLARDGESSGSIAEVLESNTVRQMKEDLGKATQRVAELSTKYGPRHPEMLKIHAEVAEVQGRLDAEINRLLANLRNKFQEAEAKERQLNAGLTTLKEEEAATKEVSVKLKELESEATTSKQLFDALLARFKQTAETADLQLPDARIIETADVPLYPAAPKRKQIVLVALIASLLAGIGIALVLEFATPGVSEGEDVERALNVAHLASVPEINDPHLIGLDAARLVRLVVAEPHGIFAETIRGIRREMDVRRRPGSAQVILVSSSLPNEGSDLIASNLAHHYALTGNRVLLIDGDLRRGPLTRRLAPQRNMGLLEVLSRGLDLGQALLHDQSTGLHFLPAMSPNSSRSLETRAAGLA